MCASLRAQAASPSLWPRSVEHSYMLGGARRGSSVLDGGVERGSESGLLGRRSSAAPAALADENGRLPPVRSVCGTPADEAWLPIASSADVRMSVGQAAVPARLRAPL